MQGNGGQGQSQSVPTVLAPGNYDGVHRGHQALICRAQQRARAQGLRACVLTFDPHPLSILAPERAPTPLTTTTRRRQLLLAHGMDDVWVQPFDQAYAAQAPDAFVRNLLAQGARTFVVGHDFRYGRAAAGNVDTLRQMGKQLGFEVLVEAPIELDGERVSSSAVRKALRAGDVGHAARLQGRYHDIAGNVERGDQRGRTLGFPTANLAAEPVLPPSDGVYAVMARVLDGQSGQPLLGVANIGTRPTFAAGRSLEVHLLDVRPDLYDKTLRVAFVARLRGERSFADPQALKQQIEADCKNARVLLGEADREKLAWI